MMVGWGSGGERRSGCSGWVNRFGKRVERGREVDEEVT